MLAIVWSYQLPAGQGLEVRSEWRCRSQLGEVLRRCGGSAARVLGVIWGWVVLKEWKYRLVEEEGRSALCFNMGWYLVLDEKSGFEWEGWWL